MKCLRIMIVLTITLLVVGYALAGQTTCPVLGGKIDKEIYTDFEGKRIYFCCKGCIAVFQKDPAKYIKKLENEGVSLEEAPSMGHKKESSQDTDKGHDKHKAHGGGCGGGCS